MDGTRKGLKAALACQCSACRSAQLKNKWEVRTNERHRGSNETHSWLRCDLRFLPGTTGRSAGRKIAQAAVRREEQSAASGGLPRLGVSLSGLRNELHSRSRRPRGVHQRLRTAVGL